MSDDYEFDKTDYAGDTVFGEDSTFETRINHDGDVVLECTNDSVVPGEEVARVTSFAVFTPGMACVLAFDLVCVAAKALFLRVTKGVPL
ncbi:membrane protein [Rhodococcus phage MacGully]|nr:membrane protein [Rhodococcus phage MacGully]